MRQRIWLTGLLLLLGKGVQADIYYYQDEQGMMHFAQTRLDRRYRFLMPSPKSEPAKPAFRQRRERPVAALPPKELREMILTTARHHRLEPALLDAVIEAESGYDPQAVSRTGAIGLMQLMPATAAELGVEDPFDIQANLQGGSRYLRRLLDEFEQLPLALAAYNAGENAVRRYGNTIPPYAETQSFVRRVMGYYYRNRKHNH